MSMYSGKVLLQKTFWAPRPPLLFSAVLKKDKSAADKGVKTVAYELVLQDFAADMADKIQVSISARELRVAYFIDIETTESPSSVEFTLSAAEGDDKALEPVVKKHKKLVVQYAILPHDADLVRAESEGLAVKINKAKTKLTVSLPQKRQ